jgi:hypothetical protein
MPTEMETPPERKEHSEQQPQQKERKRPPLRERLARYPREHPLGSVILLIAIA